MSQIVKAEIVGVRTAEYGSAGIYTNSTVYSVLVYYSDGVISLVEGVTNVIEPYLGYMRPQNDAYYMKQFLFEFEERLINDLKATIEQALLKAETSRDSFGHALYLKRGRQYKKSASLIQEANKKADKTRANNVSNANDHESFKKEFSLSWQHYYCYPEKAKNSFANMLVKYSSCLNEDDINSINQEIKKCDEAIREKQNKNAVTSERLIEAQNHYGKADELYKMKKYEEAKRGYSFVLNRYGDCFDDIAKNILKGHIDQCQKDLERVDAAKKESISPTVPESVSSKEKKLAMTIEDVNYTEDRKSYEKELSKALSLFNSGSYDEAMKGFETIVNNYSSCLKKEEIETLERKIENCDKFIRINKQRKSST